MSTRPDAYDDPLARAALHARAWLAVMPERPIPPVGDAETYAAAVGGPLPDGPTDPAAVIDLLAAQVEPGLMALGSGRFFGWVIGGVLPAALGADWLVSAWDQNTALRYATPGTVGVEQAAATWLIDLLGLPEAAQVGFVTGGTMANFTGLAAGRQSVLTTAGWDLDREGLTGAPRVISDSSAPRSPAAAARSSPASAWARAAGADSTTEAATRSESRGRFMGSGGRSGRHTHIMPDAPGGRQGAGGSHGA